MTDARAVQGIDAIWTGQPHWHPARAEDRHHHDGGWRARMLDGLGYIVRIGLFVIAKPEAGVLAFVLNAVSTASGDVAHVHGRAVELYR